LDSSKAASTTNVLRPTPGQPDFHPLATLPRATTCAAAEHPKPARSSGITALVATSSNPNGRGKPQLTTGAVS
jgi:hypothetical protein